MPFQLNEHPLKANHISVVYPLHYRVTRTEAQGSMQSSALPEAYSRHHQAPANCEATLTPPSALLKVSSSHPRKVGVKAKLHYVLCHCL